jgi:hypothetical protein
MIMLSREQHLHIIHREDVYRWSIRGGSRRRLRDLLLILHTDSAHTRTLALFIEQADERNPIMETLIVTKLNS